MTKMIRVENADTGTFKVRVWIEDLIDGEWVRQPTPTTLDYPTAMVNPYITSTRRLVVEEYV